MGERPIDMGRVVQPLYAVGTQLDHICPWRGAFRTCRIVAGRRRFVLSSEGHITGIINPHSEGSRRKYWSGEAELPEEPEAWLRRQEERRGSWWPDWTAWLSQHDNSRRPPPPLGNRKYPPRDRAPGIYVHE